MDSIQLVILALIQGITEFLPISSSAHLILPKEILGWPDQGLAFDVAVHVGSLLAVVIYFYGELWLIARDWCLSIAGKGHTENARLGWYLIAATIPAGLCGLVFESFIETHLRSVWVITITMVVFGLYLGWADKTGRKNLALSSLTLKTALIIGLAQVLALVPGTSRSGITISMALMLGFQRDAAARFSFLLSIPIILAGGGLETLELLEQRDTQWTDVFWGVALSGVSAYLCIRLFLGFINSIGMMPFVIYRLLLGAVLGGWLLIG